MQISELPTEVPHPESLVVQPSQHGRVGMQLSAVHGFPPTTAAASLSVRRRTVSFLNDNFLPKCLFIARHLLSSNTPLNSTQADLWTSSVAERRPCSRLRCVGTACSTLASNRAANKMLRTLLTHHDVATMSHYGPKSSIKFTRVLQSPLPLDSRTFAFEWKSQSMKRPLDNVLCWLLEAVERSACDRFEGTRLAL